MTISGLRVSFPEGDANASNNRDLESWASDVARAAIEGSNANSWNMDKLDIVELANFWALVDDYSVMKDDSLYQTIAFNFRARS